MHAQSTTICAVLYDEDNKEIMAQKHAKSGERPSAISQLMASPTFASTLKSRIDAESLPWVPASHEEWRYLAKNSLCE